MKRFICGFMSLCMLIVSVSAFNCFAAGANEISLKIGSNKMTVDGVTKPIDDKGTSPVIIDGRTMLPIRAVAEEMGGSTAWNNDTKEVLVIYETTSIILKVNSSVATINGLTKNLDAPPVIIGGSTYVPLRFVAEGLGFYVDWNGASQTATIRKSPASAQVAAPSGEISIDDAKTIALNNAGVSSQQAVFIKEKADFDDGVSVYDLEFLAGDHKYEYEIRVSDGTVLKAESDVVTDSRVNGSSRISPESSVSVTDERAKQIALETFGLSGKQVTFSKVERDMERGREEIEIEFYYNRAEYNCTIDAETGNVKEKEIDMD